MARHRPVLDLSGPLADEQPQGLDRAVGGLGDGGAASGQDLAGGVLGVDRVALAGQPALTVARWPVNLLDGVAVPAQEPGQADAVGPSALDPEGLQPALRTDVALAERQQLGEPGGAGGQVELGEATAETVEQDRDVLVLVGVDTDDDIVGP